MRKPDPFQELVDSLRRVLQHPSAPLVLPVRAHSSPTTATAHSTPSLVVFSSPVVRPVPFSGAAEECNGFLLQCSLETQSQLYPTEHSKIAFIISSLTGPASRWVETIWTQAGPATRSLENFVSHFREVFGTTEGDSSIGEQLYNLKQGKMTIDQYFLHFRTLAAASWWNEASLLTAFRQRLEPKLRLQLLAYDGSCGLERFIQLAIRCSNRLHSCLQDCSPANPTPRYRRTDLLRPTTNLCKRTPID